MRRITALLLTALILVSYYSPLQAQVNNVYEVVPPVNESGEHYVTTMPEAPTQEHLNQQANSMTPLQGRIATAPRGTNFEVVMNQTINSMSTRVGDSITATLEEPLIIDSQTVIPAGSEVKGQVTYIEPAGRIGRNALMDIRFTSVKLPTGDRVPLNAKILTTDSSGVLRGGKKSNIILKATGTAAATTAVGTVAGVSTGALLGSVAGGAIFGTAVGGLAGVGYAIYRKGKDIILPSGTKLGVTLEQALTVSTSKTNNY